MNEKTDLSENKEEIFELCNFDIDFILQRIEMSGAVSFRILKEDFRRKLLEEAKGYTYKEEDEYVGSGEKTVIQQMGTFKDLPRSSRFLLLKNTFNNLIQQRTSAISPYPFESKLNFNTCELIRYREGSIGITPHRDGLKFRNLVCIFSISGCGRFGLCEDRAGNNPVEFDTSPGNVVIMRAPGFMGSDKRPFHFVKDISE